MDGVENCPGEQLEVPKNKVILVLSRGVVDLEVKRGWDISGTIPIKVDENSMKSVNREIGASSPIHGNHECEGSQPMNDDTLKLGSVGSAHVDPFGPLIEMWQRVAGLVCSVNDDGNSLVRSLAGVLYDVVVD